MSFIQNLFTSRDNNANAESYVGQEGRIWWDPTTNSFYYSDGSTPGGIPIGAGGNPFNQLLNTYNDVTFANVTVTGNLDADLGNLSNVSNLSVTNTANLGNISIYDQTISGTIAGRDVTIATNDDGAKINLAAPVSIYGTGNLEAAPTFQILSDGQTLMRVPAPDSVLGAVEIVGSTSGATVAPGQTGGMLHITGQNNLVSRIYNDSINNYALYVGRRYNGTALAPTGVLLNQVVNRVGANPMASDGTFSLTGMAQISFITLENVTPTAQGSKIQMNATPVGSNVISTIAEFTSDRLAINGNIIPVLNNQYTLGNTTNQWKEIHAGPGGLYLEDLSTGIDAQLTVDSNVFVINNVTALEVGNIQLTKDGIVNTQIAGNINIGTTGDTGWLHVQNAGIEFPDGTQQTTAAIPLTQKGNALGVVPLNGATKIDPIYLPAGGISFQGIWNAANNTPTLADGTGTPGDEWIVGTAGTQNLGSGNINFAVGDFVLYTSSNVWVDVPVGGSGVTSFNTRTGAVTLTSGDVTNALSNSSIINSKLVNSSLTVNTGIGISGGQVIPLGGSMTLINTGVTAAVAGTGVSVSAATGNVTFSIGQPVGTANSVQFAGITSTTTVAATGNITGGNLATGGRVVATGNIVTLANVVTPGTVINSSVSTTGNVIGGNLIGQNLTAGRVAIVGSGKQVADDADFTYNSSTNVLSVAGNVNAAYFNGNIIGDGSQLTGVITTILPTTLSNTVHIAANTVGNTATIITDATTASVANTIVVRDASGGINVNNWSINARTTGTSTTATATDYWIGCTAKNLTITLPNAANGAAQGRQYLIVDCVQSGAPGDTIATEAGATVVGGSLSQQGQSKTCVFISATNTWYCN